MAERRGTGGRPGKGKRDLLSTRLPMDLSDSVRDEADSLGLTISDHLANLVAAHFGRPAIAASTPPQQERLIA